MCLNRPFENINCRITFESSYCYYSTSANSRFSAYHHISKQRYTYLKTEYKSSALWEVIFQRFQLADTFSNCKLAPEWELDAVLRTQLASFPVNWNPHFRLTMYWAWFNPCTVLHRHAYAQVVQFVLKIGFALTKRVGWGEEARHSHIMTCALWLPWLAVERPWSALANWPFNYCFDTNWQRNHSRSPISGTVSSFQSTEAFTGRRALNIVKSLMMGVVKVMNQ